MIIVLAYNIILYSSVSVIYNHKLLRKRIIMTNTIYAVMITNI